MNSRSSMDSHDDSSYSATFRELFCVTAQEIARSLDTGLQNLGCLYEEVLTTGTLLNRILYYAGRGKNTIMAADFAPTGKDIEAGIISPVLFGKGQLLILTRRVDATEGNRLQNLGYRFANVDQVGEQLARSLQIPRGDLEDLVGRLQSFSQREPAVPTRGAYLASFLVQPSPSLSGLEIVVPRATPDRLPMVELSSVELTPRQLQLLRAFNGLPLDECLTRISQRSNKGSTEDYFLDLFRNKIVELLRSCPESTLHRAIFSARQFDIAHGMAGQMQGSPATVFAFCGIKEIYIQTLQSLILRTTPFSFFQTYLRSYPGSPDHAILAQKNHKEFTALTRVSPTPQAPKTRRSRFWPSRRTKSRSSPSEMSWHADSASEKGLVSVASQSTSETVSHPWGSIMVTSTQKMTIVENNGDGSSLEMKDLGVKAEIGVAETEGPTLADRLMSITTGFRDPLGARGAPKDLYNGRGKPEFFLDQPRYF